MEHYLNYLCTRKYFDYDLVHGILCFFILLYEKTFYWVPFFFLSIQRNDRMKLNRSALIKYLVIIFYGQVTLDKKADYAKIVFTKIELMVPKTVSMCLLWLWVSPYSPRKKKHSVYTSHIYVAFLLNKLDVIHLFNHNICLILKQNSISNTCFLFIISRQTTYFYQNTTLSTCFVYNAHIFRNSDKKRRLNFCFVTIVTFQLACLAQLCEQVFNTV